MIFFYINFGATNLRGLFLFKKSNLKVLSISLYSGGAVLLFNLLDNLNLERLEFVDISCAIDLNSMKRCSFSANEVILTKVNTEYLVMIIKMFVSSNNVLKCTVFFGNVDLNRVQFLNKIQFQIGKFRLFQSKIIENLREQGLTIEKKISVKVFTYLNHESWKITKRIF